VIGEGVVDRSLTKSHDSAKQTPKETRPPFTQSCFQGKAPCFVEWLSYSMPIGLTKECAIEKVNRVFNGDAKRCIIFFSTNRKENKIRVTNQNAK
jgi:hypothetical protein